MKYFRVHTADYAWITKQPRGIFAAIGKLADAKTMDENEIIMRCWEFRRLPMTPK